MSEYQYYEFQAIDRPLTAKEMAELRSYSTRARITPTSFVNDYSWGDFKGNPDAWMEKYFDAFLYVANWGTHVLKLGLPARLLDAKSARLYCAGEHVSVWEKNSKAILTFQSDEEEGGEWVEGEGLLASLISVRAELARGDLRALYLGWLLCAQSGDLDDDDVEPPVPAGLGQLSASLESSSSFFASRERTTRTRGRDCQSTAPRCAGGPGPAVWKQVESLIATRQPKRYDEAVMLLVDLRDIAARKVATTSGGASRSCALYTRASRRRLRACAKVGGVTPLAALCRHQRR